MNQLRLCHMENFLKSLPPVGQADEANVSVTRHTVDAITLVWSYRVSDVSVAGESVVDATGVVTSFSGDAPVEFDWSAMDVWTDGLADFSEEDSELIRCFLGAY